MMSRRYERHVGCRIEGCDRPHQARGYCNPHYTRLRHRKHLHLSPTVMPPFVDGRYRSGVKRVKAVELAPRYTLASIIDLLERNRLYFTDRREYPHELAERLGLNVKLIRRLMGARPPKTISFQTADEICTAIGYYVEHLEVAS